LPRAPPPGIPALVTNHPFSAQAWTTITVARPDGTTTKIAQRADIARNSAGSTRHEIRRLTSASPTGQPTGSVSVNIHDEPNHLSVHLAPATSTASVAKLRPSTKPQSLPVAIPFGAVITAQNQDLGQRSIDGYSVTGSRLSLLFPAGTKRPAQDVTETRDTWFSSDLQTVLLTETNDSLGNSSSTALTHIKLGEPDPTLFTIPGNYSTTNVARSAPASTTLQAGATPAISITRPTGTQTPGATSSQQPYTIPLSHLYRHFYLYEAHLEHVADAHPEEPKGGAIKDHMRQKTGLSEAEWQTVSATSLRMETTLKALNTQANALIEEDRQTCQFSKLSCLPDPPNLPKRKELQKQQDQAIAAETTALETALGPDATAKLRAYLQSDTASHVTVIPISPAALKAAQQAAEQARKAVVQ